MKIYDVYRFLKSPREKNKLLKEIIEKIIYFKSNGGRWNKAQDDLEILIYPKIPDVI